MRAVWKAARAAVRRRRLQTVVIWLVTLVSTGSMVVALGLVAAASGPFDEAFGEQRGPHVVAAFDPHKVPDVQLRRAARASAVEAVSGPFSQATVTIPRGAGDDYGLGGELTVVGRPGPGGAVDKVELWAGRWATGPGEVVVNRPSDWTADDLGKKLRLPSGPTLTIVGFGFDLSRTADSWVAPGQIAALHPTATQMLLRFKNASSEKQLRAGLSSVTGGLPTGALTSTQSYLLLKHQIGSSARAFAPYLMTFGILGILVAVLIVANVVSGAVISGFRHIGILKALGFTPGQVLAVYLAMISAPAVLGCALGTVCGNLLARPFFEFVFTGPDAGVFHDSVGIAPWVNVVALLGVPAVCLLAALAPSLRARALSAARAISAGSAPRAGRALGIQRRLAGTRLARSVSLGMGLPFARPGRSALTLAAVVLGVTTVTFATGLATTMTRFSSPERHPYDVTVYASNFRHGKEIQPEHGDRALERLLRSLPGATHVAARGDAEVVVAGTSMKVFLEGHRGDPGLETLITKGRLPHGTGEVTAGEAFLRQNGLKVGDRLRLRRGERREDVTIVGENMLDTHGVVAGDWSTFTALAPEERPIAYHIRLRDGAAPQAYARAARAADRGVSPTLEGPNNLGRTIIGSAAMLTLMLAVVTSLGVFNTVVLNTHDRRRDLGMLKSIGMTPRQVTTMMVTSMAVLGVIGSLLGIPLGIAGYEAVMPRMAGAIDVTLPSYMTDVWHAPALGGLALAGLVIALLGSFVPARRAARLTVAEVLHSE
ncbi:ABC transporter permease [Streptomyces sp. V3I7]|uniref:ABC transporter permease n=1 Tax=Streptomyces sp. V3I7 TaxID=3042278 RepID=UPI00278A9E98|nr:FtsX-like permease family protein [Streptomyces sp. V3I7]MDQ0989156.1 putative ABC transport system permease protein [Streptomyces sp. V3I7]